MPDRDGNVNGATAQSPRQTRSRWVLGAIALTLLLATITYVAAHHTQVAALPGHDAAAGQPPDRSSAATALVQRLAHGLQRHDVRKVEDLAAAGDPAARAHLVAMAQNVERIGITGLTLRYVDDETAPTDVEPAGGRADELVVVAELDWHIRGFDRGTSRMQIKMLANQTRRGLTFVSIRPSASYPAPLWTLEPLRVERSQDSLVMLAGEGSVSRLSRLARRAVVEVRKVLPHWSGKLVVEAPGSEGELDHVVGSRPHVDDAIASVTSVVDGSLSPSSPVHVFINPSIFDGLGPKGAQVVLSHETTHVATHAVISMMPSWVIEGFADYVALDHAGVPVSVAASQILARVRKRGAARHLPTAGDFGTQSDGLGSTYESAWLACRLIAEKYGEPRLIRFYRLADQHSSSTYAFPRVLGTTQRNFTRQWRSYETRLAAR